jgi:glycosyltransferase involved in cell wall biosynthesis
MISVITPIYNADRFLNTAVDAVLNQTFTNFELLLINDGSTDGSKDICEEYRSKDNRVVVVNTENRGPSAARNTGIEKASGRFLFFLDADDYLEPTALQTLYDQHLLHDSDLTISDFVKVRGDETLSSGHSFNGDFVFDQKDILSYINKYLASPNKYPLLTQSWGRLFTKEIVTENNIKFNTDLRTFEDVEFNFKYLRYVTTLVFVDAPLYKLSLHTDHFSATMRLVDTPDSLFGYREALRQAQVFLKEKKVDKSFQINLLKAYTTYSIIQLIRLSIQQTSTNKQVITNFVDTLLQDALLQQGLSVYQPKKGDSVIIPWLMRWGFARALLYICNRRGSKRYNPQ